MAYPTLHCERCDYVTEPSQHVVFLARHIRDAHNKRELFLQASRLIVSLNDERICALAACNWGRAERLKHLMNRARVRARRRHSYPSIEEISNDEDIYDLVGWNRR